MDLEIERTILGMSHAYFRDRKITPKGIKEYIKRSRAFYYEESINEEWLYRRLHDIHLAR